MTKSNESSWKPRIFAALSIMAIFTIGIAAGAGLHHLYRPKHRCPPPPPPPMFKPLPLEKLGLSDSQWQQVRRIMARHRPALEKVLRQTYPRVRTINKAMEKEILGILTPAQRKRLHSLEARKPPMRWGDRPMAPPMGPPMGPPLGPRGGRHSGPPMGPPMGPTTTRSGGPSKGPSGATSVKTQPLGVQAKKILSVIRKLEAGRYNMGNVPQNDGRLLRLLVASVGAQKVVEVGTANGYSSLWMSLGLLRTGGRITSFEIDPKMVRLARANFQAAGVDKLVTIVVGDAFKKIETLKGPIDVLFLDADGARYVGYLEKLLPKVRPGGLIISHNMVRPKPVPKYIKRITTDPALETLFFHMQGDGIAVSLKKRSVVK